jgi:hypothetical protein
MLITLKEKLSPSSSMNIDAAGHITTLILPTTGLHGVITLIFTAVKTSNHTDH